MEEVEEASVVSLGIAAEPIGPAVEAGKRLGLRLPHRRRPISVISPPGPAWRLDHTVG